jgi:hypothetical protein
MNGSSPQPYSIFIDKFRVKKLAKIYEENYSKTKLKGVDRINSYTFSAQAKKEISLISRKAISGDYKFSPYLENLKGKGRGKEPRILAVPTLRDRIALYALKETLFEIFPKCVDRKLANQHVRDLKQALENIGTGEFGFFKTDITNFYGSISKEKLLVCLGREIKSKKLKKMIWRAITRPVVPKVYNRCDLKNFTVGGVPQGLSISNILAEIYLHDLDEEMNNLPNVKYYSRYVDDILIIADKIHLPDIVSIFRQKIEDPSGLDLQLNKSKTFSNIHNLGLGYHADKFTYLGYTFDFPKVAPREQSEERFIRSIIAIFTEYKKSTELRGKKKRLLFRVNQKLTGAINENRRYGWIFYFMEMNDLSSLYKIDSIVSRMFLSLEEFDGQVPAGLKKIVRAYYHSLYTPREGYIHDYNRYRNNVLKREFLLLNQYINKEDEHSDKKIEQIFEDVKYASLSDLMQDEMFIS